MRPIKSNKVAVIVLLINLAAAGTGCGRGNLAKSLPPPQPTGTVAPMLGSLSPASVIVGGSGFTLMVNGSNFAASTVVQWNGQPVPTIFVSGQQVTATISSSLVASVGSDPITAQNAESSESNSLLFAVNYPTLQITSTLPNSVMAGAANLPFTINGVGFIDDTSGVVLNGIPQPTAWVSPTQLQTTIPASYLATPGPINFLVEDFSPDGSETIGPASNVATVTVTPIIRNPVPALDSSVDTAVPAGWKGFELRVNGSNFVAASVLRWNGIDLPTLVTSSTQLRAAIPADQLVSPGLAQVTVFNNSPGGGTSGSLPVLVQAMPPSAVGAIDLSNIRNDLFNPDTGGDSSKVSGDGRFVVFRSGATDLAPGSPCCSMDVYLRDTCIGAQTGCVPSVTSLPLTSDSIAISANGRFVGAMANQYSVSIPTLVLFDDCFGAPAGCVPAALPITAIPTTYKSGLSLSADGRFAVFSSTGCNLGDDCAAPQLQAFLVDTCAGVSSGCTPSSEAVSPASTATGTASDPSISPDGRFVTFNTSDQDVSLIDTCKDGPANCSPSNTVVSVAFDGSPANADSLGGTPSSSGRYVTFLSRATNLVPGGLSSGVTRVYLRDMCTGGPTGCTPTTTLVAVAGDANFFDVPSISSDGRYIAFSSTASDLVPGDTNGAQDIFVYDSCAGVSSGCTPSTQRVSVALDGTQGTGASLRPTISSDGRFVAFDSSAKLAPGGISGYTLEIYLARH